MEFLKKTIILSNKKDNFKSLGVLTVFKNNAGIFGALRCYDINEKSVILGISVDNKQILKQNIDLNNTKTYNFKLDNTFNINGKIGCVLVCVDDNCVKPLIYGSSEPEMDYKAKVIESLNNSINNIYTKHIQSKVMQKENNLDETILEENIQKEQLDKVQNNQIFNDEIIKEYEAEKIRNDEKNEIQFYKPMKDTKVLETAPLFEYDEKEVDEKINEELKEDNDFYNMISEQIDELFVKYPREKRLEELIEESKWVKVDFENNGHYYVVGLIYDSGNLKYVCYGVPGTYSSEPPKELEDYSQWIPFNSLEPEGEGYWLMYQDANTGESGNLSNE